MSAVNTVFVTGNKGNEDSSKFIDVEAAGTAVAVSVSAGSAPSRQSDTKASNDNEDDSFIDGGSREPFLTSPWWAPGHKVKGMDPGTFYINENAVRARAGLLMAFAFVVITLLVHLERPSDVVPYMGIPILLDFIAGTVTGLTPLAPVGMLGTLLTRFQKPVWKPYSPKRFAWSLGIVMVTTCLLFSALSDPDMPGRRYYMIGLASVCVVLTYLESAVGFCLGCYIHNKLAPSMGWEVCQECQAESLISGTAEASADSLRELVASCNAVVFSKTKCPFCVRAKKALKDASVDYHVVELDTEDGAKWVPTLMKSTGQKTVPYVYLQSEFVGGATDLEALIAAGQLQEHLNRLV